MNTQESGTQHNAIPPLPVEDERRGFRIHPGTIVAVLGVLLIGLIAIGIFVNRESEPGVEATTIAELRADPTGWDNRRVTLTGTAESVRELPILSQYAIYTFRDETGSMLALTRNGAPPSDGQRLQVEAVFHSKVRLDDELKEIVSDQLGPLAGSVVSTLVPGVPLDVVYLGHDSYDVLGTPEGG
ncbi:MAG TPA: hypothetical protein VFV93_03685 [Thermomicrobiales bacterium]|nr:hypothetical protein [Thermomicrobiales bacterium]